jgi:hypothetical protein
MFNKFRINQDAKAREAMDVVDTILGIALLAGLMCFVRLDLDRLLTQPHRHPQWQYYSVVVR